VSAEAVVDSRPDQSGRDIATINATGWLIAAV